MKWTKDLKEKAVDMIKNGVAKSDIVLSTGMSLSSINLLTSKVHDYDERIICQICGKKFKQITHRHLGNHNITFDEYIKLYPGHSTSTGKRIDLSKAYKNPNKGKTYKEIYGEKESMIKRKKISEKQIGRPAAKDAGTGIAGIRKDTQTFARSTYEANIDRIFIYENKKFIGEFGESNFRFMLRDRDGTLMSYQPDRVDVEGLFSSGAFIEVKGFMTEEGWRKICLFREQYPSYKLIVISRDKNYMDIDYNVLENEYRDKIELWESDFQNYRTHPHLYKVGYQLPDEIVARNYKYPQNINKDIVDKHEKFIAKKCISFNKVKMGKNVFVEYVKLLAISCRKNKWSRKSSGNYNYEMWEVGTESHGKFYVGNIKKTVVFYCYSCPDKLLSFFKDNTCTGLLPGQKNIYSHELIDDNLWDNFSEKDKDIIQELHNTLKHHGYRGKVLACDLIQSCKTKRGSYRNKELWRVKFENDCGEIVFFEFSNFHKQTAKYFLRLLAE